MLSTIYPYLLSECMYLNRGHTAKHKWEAAAAAAAAAAHLIRGRPAPLEVMRRAATAGLCPKSRTAPGHVTITGEEPSRPGGRRIATMVHSRRGCGRACA